MTTKIIFAITLLAYAMIASQAFMYILSLKHVQLNLGANSYTEIRKLIDISMRASFKYVIYAALLANVLLVILATKTPSSLVFITATIALFALVAEILLTLKGNLPINDVWNKIIFYYWSNYVHETYYQNNILYFITYSTYGTKQYFIYVCYRNSS